MMSSSSSRRETGSNSGDIRRWLLWVSFALLQLAPLLAAHAEQSVTLERRDHRVLLLDHLEFAEDRADVAPASAEIATLPWAPVIHHSLKGNFGIRQGNYWLRHRLVVDAAGAGEWQLRVENARLDLVEVWTVRSGQWEGPQSSGLVSLAQGKPAKHRFPGATLHVSPGEVVDVYIRVRSSGWLQVPVFVTPSALQERNDQLGYLGLGLYFGVLAGLWGYNAFLAVALRGSAYAWYLGMTACAGLYWLTSTGVGAQLVWPQWSLAMPRLLNFSSIVGTVFALEFTRRFLNLRTLANPLHRTILVLQAVWVVIILMHLIWTPGALVTPLIAPAALITTLLIVICGFVGLRRRAPGALYFCIAWSALLGSGALVALTRGGALPYLPLGDPLAMLGSAAELMLLSLALGDRMQGERRARARAEALRLAEQVQREAAQHALREKSAFMASVVHDLQQPIYALNLTTTSLARKSTDLALASHVISMQSALRSADDLLSSLAMVVRLDRADLQPEIGDFCIQYLLEQVSELFGPLAKQRGLDWRVTPSMAMVHSDPKLLERMVSNLVSNAMRYTQRGGVLLACRLRSDHLLIQVWDTGRGIHPDEQAAVFEMHYRGTEASANEQGLGLGLSIVRRCANLLDIRVSLRSVPGRGSCFELRVPLGAAQPSST